MMDMETRLRRLVSEILNPFSDKFAEFQKQQKNQELIMNTNRDQMMSINQKLDRETKTREFVSDLNREIRIIART